MYFKEMFKNVSEKTLEAESILQSQIFGQHMLENLVNDLMDLAKVENN